MLRKSVYLDGDRVSFYTILQALRIQLGDSRQRVKADRSRSRRGFNLSPSICLDQITSVGMESSAVLRTFS